MYPVSPSVSGMLTTDVCSQIVVPATKSTSSAYVDLLRVKTHPVHGPAVVPKAHAFVSHAWNNPFAELCKAVSRVLESPELTFALPGAVSSSMVIVPAAAHSLESTGLWIDIFVVNQHATKTLKPEWWTSSFAKAVSDIGRVISVCPVPPLASSPLSHRPPACGREATCLPLQIPIRGLSAPVLSPCNAQVLEPWQAPVPLTRSWCVWPPLLARARWRMLWRVMAQFVMPANTRAVHYRHRGLAPGPSWGEQRRTASKPEEH